MGAVVETDQVHVISHRSCTGCPGAQARNMNAQMNRMDQCADLVPIGHKHMFWKVPDQLLKDPKWKKHTQPGVRGRGYWFWKPELIHMFLRQKVIKDDDWVIWIDGDWPHKLHDLYLETVGRGR